MSSVRTDWNLVCTSHRLGRGNCRPSMEASRHRTRARLIGLAVAWLIACVLGIALPSVPAFAETASASYTADRQPELQASSALLVDRDTGTVLLDKDSGAKRYPASTTKLMTALLVIEHGGLDETVTMEQGDFDALDADSMTAGLKVGETLSVKNLLACLLLPSANEAAYALARHVSGDYQTFVVLMNTRAKELGCTGTHFANPCGLHDGDHYSTAHDLALIMEEDLKHQEFTKIDGSPTWNLPATNKNPARTIASTDLLIDKASSVYMNGEVVAGKTGYTDDAGKCLVSAAVRDGMNLVGVVLDAPSSADASGVTANFTDMKALLDWGFGAWQTTRVVSTGTSLGTVPVRLSSDGDAVAIAAAGSITATVPRGTKVSDLSIAPAWTEELRAPLDAGEHLGKVDVSLGDRKLGTVAVVAAAAAGLSIPAWIADFLANPVHAGLVAAVAVALIALLALALRGPGGGHGGSGRGGAGRRNHGRGGRRSGSAARVDVHARGAHRGPSGRQSARTSGREGGAYRIATYQPRLGQTPRDADRTGVVGRAERRRTR